MKQKSFIDVPTIWWQASELFQLPKIKAAEFITKTDAERLTSIQLSHPTQYHGIGNAHIVQSILSSFPGPLS